MKQITNRWFILLLIGLLFVVILILINLLFIGGNKTNPTPSPTASFIPKVINPQGDTILLQTADYQIDFQPLNRKYLISILTAPFSEIRPQAEADFLRVAKLTKEEACKLDVSIAASYRTNPQEFGRQYRLSFCLDDVVFKQVTINPNLPNLTTTEILPKP